MVVVDSSSQNLLDLVAAACDGRLAAERVAELEQALLADPAAQDLYLDYFRLDTQLSALWQEQRSREVLDRIEKLQLVEPAYSWFDRAYDFISHTMALSLLIAGLFCTIVVLSLAVISMPELTNRSPKVPSRDDYAARIYDSQDAAWNLTQGQAEPQWKDDLLIGQPLDLASGFVRIRYDNGTMVLLEGPARFTVTGQNSGQLLRGKLVARVSKEATGFIVSSLTGTVTDLGTEFGAYVGPSDDLEVAVFDGKVRLETSGESRELGVGQSARVTGNSVVQGDGSTRFARVLPREAPGAYSLCVLADKPLAYYRLSSIVDEKGDRFTANGVRVAFTTPQPGLNRSNGFAGVEDFNRWANFDGGESSTLTELKTGWNSNAGTISYWVRADEDGHPTQTHLFASDDGDGVFGKSVSIGCIGTFARKDGSFGFSIDGFQIDAPAGTIGAPLAWNHFAFTWQREAEPANSTIALYLNGELIKSVTTEPWTEFTIAATRFGKEQSGNSRIFSGSLDELALFAEALSAEAIQQQVAVAKAASPAPIESSSE